MKVKINSYGGIVGWLAHKYFSSFTISFWLHMLEIIRYKNTKEYVNAYIEKNPPPLFEMIEIETINRCNGECSFCPANKYVDKRPFYKMESEVFEKIISELKDINYKGSILLEVNNEPLVDVRLTDFAKLIKERIPDCSIQIITNGTLLTIDKLKALAPYLDNIIINNYSEKYKLNSNIRDIYKYAKKDKLYGTEIEIRRRYVREILTNRAGSAPNKQNGSKISAPCLYPFVGITIFSNGNVGLCSNDCFETTNFGNVNNESLISIWQSEKMTEMRKQISKGRKHYSFCENCDVIGIGTREKIAADEDI